MKKLAIKCKVTLTLFAVLFGVNLLGQTRTELNGSGTSDDPYQIGSAAEWTKFATNSTYWDSYVKLTSDIPNATEVEGGTNYVSTIVGFEDDEKSFSGIFDGDNNTLTFNSESYGAPFYSTCNATIHDLIVLGTITVLDGYSAGLIYKNYDVTTVSNVTVSVNINNSEGGSAGNNCAGFVVENVEYEEEQGLLNFSECVYNGKIVAGTNSGGFCANMYNGTATFINCIFNPTSDSSISGGENFGTGTVNAANCYYTKQVGTSIQGKRLYKNYSDAENIIVKPWEVLGENVFGPVTVTTTAEETYLFDSGTDHYSTVTGCDVTFDGETAVLDTDYEVKVKSGENVVTVVTAAGEYQLVIEGKGNYHGSYSKTFYVVSELTGEGTSENPFKIRSSADWLIFANHVNNGDIYTDAAKTEHNYSDAYYKLTDNITVSTMVGTSAHPFSGHFDGATGVGYNINTLTFNYGTNASPTEEQIVAPFRYTNGATIQYLWVSGAIHTNVGKEAGLIGVNTRTSKNTTVDRVIVDLNFYCYEDLWDEEGGGFAYDGSGITFTSCAYQGTISAENYHGGFCGNANSTTTFADCLFNPSDDGIYWAENFVWNNSGATIGTTCYYTEGNNQEESEQGKKVYVVYAEHPLPAEVIGKKLTTLYGRGIYEPVNVVISGVNKRYTYTGSDITITPTGITFDGENALVENNEFCTWSITPSPVNAVRQYTFTVTAPNPSVESNYLGSVTQLVRVVESSSTGWTGLQNKLSGSESTITLTESITAGESDVCLVIESGRTVTINLNGKTIDRGFYNGNDSWNSPVSGGQVLKIASGATVTIVGPGTIRGGCNKASSNVEHAENSDAGGIFNMGSLTLNNVTIEGNYCEKYSTTISRTARGGGIYSGKSSTLIINNCTITHNEAKGGGGGIFAEQAAVFMMDNTTVQSNKSQDKGGGVRIDATNTKHTVADGKALVNGALFNDCHISSNTVVFHNAQSASNGGGIHLDAGTLYLTSCTINNNNSSKYGGGIYMMGGTIHADNCSILYNKSYDSSDKFEGYGGGVCILNGTYNMNGGIVYENSSYKQDGGGIFVASGKTLNISGNVNITENWTDEESLSSKHTSNVYLVGSNDKIHITGSIAGSTIGVDKNGKGVFTSGLSGNGTVANFTSDDTNYQVLPYSGEAKLGVPETAAPPASGTWEINSAQVLTTAVSGDVTSITFGTDGCLYVNEGGLITSATSITNSDVNKLIINGGQIVTTSGTVNATYKKSISSGWTWGENWYLISSPFSNISITNNTNLVSKDGNNNSTYDLYRFNESVVLQWENYRNDAHTDFTTLANGRGYMYRNKDDYTITMTGVLQTSEVNYSLTCTDQVNSVDNKLKGFNLLGNPYSHNIYKNDVYASSGDVPAINNANLSVGYYKLKRETDKADVFEATIGYNNPILPGEGFLVQTSSAINLTITNTTNAAASYSPSKGQRGSELDNIMFEVSNNNYHDVTYAMFSNGRGLNKIGHLDAEAPMIYIKNDSEKYAIATMDGNAKSINLSFEAMTTGIYTLKIKPQGDFNYIHVFDKLTGRDIDMLADGEYSFIGAPNDQDDRFIVRLCETVTDSNGNAIFAYQNGNDIIVDGNGELQVFDITGRLITTQHINGVHGICTSSLQAGVYILRLNEMSQKIVVR